MNIFFFRKNSLFPLIQEVSCINDNQYSNKSKNYFYKRQKQIIKCNSILWWSPKFLTNMINRIQHSDDVENITEAFFIKIKGNVKIEK